MPQRQENSTYPFTSLLGRTSVESRVVTGDGQVVAQAATIETVPAPAHVAQALGLQPSDSVHLVQRLKLVDTRPAAHIASYLDAAVFPDLARHSGEIYYLYEFLATTYGTGFARSRSRVTAVAADFIESRLLDVPVGSPLVLHTRVTESPDGPIEYAESYERPDLLETFITVAPESATPDALLAYEM